VDRADRLDAGVGVRERLHAIGAKALELGPARPKEIGGGFLGHQPNPT
jgi:hypothetical protein